MAMSDVIGDMLTRIRNAQKSKLLKIVVPYSSFKAGVLNVLLEEGYIKSFKILTDGVFLKIEVDLKYSFSGQPAICRITKLSKPGKRVYVSSKELFKKYRRQMGVFILSTSKGVLSNKAALGLSVGGELVCEIF